MDMKVLSVTAFKVPLVWFKRHAVWLMANSVFYWVFVGPLLCLVFALVFVERDERGWLHIQPRTLKSLLSLSRSVFLALPFKIRLFCFSHSCRGN